MRPSAPRRPVLPHQLPATSLAVSAVARCEGATSYRGMHAWSAKRMSHRAKGCDKSAREVATPARATRQCPATNTELRV